MNTCSRAKEGHIVGLFHETSLSNIGKILRSGFLYTSAEFGTLFPKEELVGLTVSQGDDWKGGGQFQGVYFRPFFDFLVSTPLFPRKKSKDPSPFSTKFTEYVMVFSNVLLERNDYHINLNDQNGFITADSYRPTEMKKLALHRADHPKTFAEVVFHRRVPAPFVQEIWVLADSKEQFDKRRAALIEELKGTGYECLIQADFRTTFPNQQYNRGCEEVKLVAALQASAAPNFCTAFPLEIVEGGVNPKAIASLEKYNAIAKDCGLDESTIQSLDAKPDETYRALREAIHTKEVEHTVSMIRANRNTHGRVHIAKGVHQGHSGVIVSSTDKKVVVELSNGSRVSVHKTSVVRPAKRHT